MRAWVAIGMILFCLAAGGVKNEVTWGRKKKEEAKRQFPDGLRVKAVGNYLKNVIRCSVFIYSLTETLIERDQSRGYGPLSLVVWQEWMVPLRRAPALNC